MIVQQYRIHGISLDTRTESAVLAEALENRLQFFTTESSSLPDCRLELRLLPRDELIRSEPPANTVTQLLMQDGESSVVYQPQHDTLHFSYQGGLKAMVDRRENLAQVLIPKEAVECIRRLKHAVFMLPLVELLRPHGLYNTHAAGLQINGKGLLFPAECGSGKTTLTLALARAGFGFLSDDLIFLKREGTRLSMHAFPDDVDVTENTVRMFPDIERWLRPQIPGCLKRQLSVPDAYGTRIVANCEPAAIICPRIAHTEKTGLEPLSPVEAFLEFAKNVTFARLDAAQEHLDVIGALLEQVPCYRMHTGRDLQALPTLLSSLVA